MTENPICTYLPLVRKLRSSSIEREEIERACEGKSTLRRERARARPRSRTERERWADGEGGLAEGGVAANTQAVG